MNVNIMKNSPTHRRRTTNAFCARAFGTKQYVCRKKKDDESKPNETNEMKEQQNKKKKNYLKAYTQNKKIVRRQF